MNRHSIVLCLALCLSTPGFAQLGGAFGLVTRHTHSKKGEWEINWYTDSRGAFSQVEMIRSYPNNSAFRMVWGVSPRVNAIDLYIPLNQRQAVTNVTWYFGPPDPANMMTSTLAVHQEANTEDTWLRISQPTDAPGVEDSVSNSDSVTFIYGTAAWNFNLKGSNAAYKTFVELWQQGLTGNVPAPATNVPVRQNAPMAQPGGTVHSSPVFGNRTAPLGENPYADLGNWKVTYVNDSGGNFSQALATRHYPDGSSFRIVVGKGGFQALDFRGDFSSVTGDEIQSSCTFDTANKVVSGAAYKIGDQDLKQWYRMVIADDPKLGEALVNSHNVRFQSGSAACRYPLDGSGEALQSLILLYRSNSPDR